LRLKPSFRYAIYAAFAVLFLTGAGWFIADWQKDISSDEIWQQVAANMLMVHGGAAMLALLMIGALIPLHLLRSWRAKKNRVTGSVMAAFNAILIVTAFGLYYLGSEAVRPWMSWIHIGAGLLLALMFPLHIVLGRRPAQQLCGANAEINAAPVPSE
jgi:cytochrome c biogenesis protein CcdA